MGNSCYYKFLVLPFGLSSACSIFTKVTRPLVAKWLGEQKFVSMYLDDEFGCTGGQEATALGKEIIVIRTRVRVYSKSREVDLGTSYRTRVFGSNF